MHQNQIHPGHYSLPLGNPSVPIVLNTQPQTSTVHEGYHVKCVRGLSITQIVLGCLAIILQLWDIINGSHLSFVGAGMWSGPFFIIAGGLGVASCNTRTTCSIVAFLVMSIIASVMTISLLSPSAINWGIYSETLQSYDSYYGFSYEQRPPRDTLRMIIAVSAMMVFVALIQAVVAIISSCFACQAVCCTGGTPGTVLVQGQVQYVQGPNGQVQMVVVPMMQSAPVLTAGHQIQHTTNMTPGYQPQPLMVPTGSSENHTAATQVNHHHPIQPVLPPPYTTTGSLTPAYNTADKTQP